MQNYGRPRTLRMETDTYKIVMACPGRNFSEKLRYIVDTFATQNPAVVKKAWEKMTEGGNDNE